MRRFGRFGTILAMLLLLGTLGHAQSNTVTVQVVPPASWTITVSPMNYAQNTAKTMTITVTAGPVSNACTASWDALPLALTFPATLTPDPVALTAQVTAAMTATVGPHSVLITCPQPTLTMNNPVQLPNGKVGSVYSASLVQTSQLAGGVQPYQVSCSGLPAGLSCTSAGLVTGTPSGSGSFNFSFTVKDSSGLALLRSMPRLISGGA